MIHSYKQSLYIITLMAHKLLQDFGGIGINTVQIYLLFHQLLRNTDVHFPIYVDPLSLCSTFSFVCEWNTNKEGNSVTVWKSRKTAIHIYQPKQYYAAYYKLKGERLAENETKVMNSKERYVLLESSKRTRSLFSSDPSSTIFILCCVTRRLWVRNEPH